MDWSTVIQEVIDAHDDTIEILSAKLVAWISGSSAVTFNLTSGDYTIDSVSQIVAGTTTVVAGENLAKNDLVRLELDGSDVKAYKLIEQAVKSNSAGVGNVQGVYYSSTFDRFVILYTNGASTTVDSMIGSIAEDGTITFGSAVNLVTGATGVSDIRALDVGGTKFMLSWLDGADLQVQYWYFSDASTLANVGSVLSLTSSGDVLGYRAEHGNATECVLYGIDNGATYIEPLSSVLIEDSSGASVVAGSLQTIYSGSGILNVSTFNVGYNRDEGEFHVLYNHFVTPDYIEQHVAIDEATGAHDVDEVMYTTTTANLKYPKLISYDSESSQLVVLYVVYASSVEYLYLSKYQIVDNELLPLNAVYLKSYFPISTSGSSPQLGNAYMESVFDKNTGLIYVKFRDASTRSLMMIVDIDKERVINTIEYDSSASPFTYQIGLSANHVIMGSAASTNAYVIPKMNEKMIAGITIELKTAGNDITLALSGSRIASLTATYEVGKTYYVQPDMTLGNRVSMTPFGKAIGIHTIQIF